MYKNLQKTIFKSYLLINFNLFPGERLEDDEIDEIIKLTQLHIDLDGNVKYEGMFARLSQNFHIN